MVMNKKGFLKILEAIIAIVVVFSFVVAIFPEKTKSLGKLPPALQETMDSVLKDMKENAKFRDCVLKEDGGGSQTASFSGFDVQGIGADCIYNYISQITVSDGFSPWLYAVGVCKTLENNEIASPPDCKYNINNNAVAGYNKEQKTENFRNGLDALTKEQNVYIRSATISVSDASEVTIAEGDIPNVDALKDKIKDVHLITIYAWSKE